MNATVCLQATSTKFVRDEADLDDSFTESFIRVPATIFHQAVALAEITNPEFRAPANGQYFGAQSQGLARGLKIWVETEHGIEPPKRQSHQTAIHQLTDFFRAPANKKWLAKILTFAAESRGFTIQ